MAKDNTQKEIRGATNMARLTGDTEYDALNKKIGGRDDTTWDRATENYNPAYQGYLSYAQGGGLTDEDKQRMQGAIDKLGDPSYGSSGGGGGGVSNTLGGKTSNYRGLSSAFNNAYRPDYGEADTGFRKLAGEGGGFDADQLKQIYGNIGQLSDIGRTGGITDEDRANINRQSILDQEKDGGYSEQDRALIRAKSAASSPAYFGALKDNLQRQRSQTGNLANAGAMDFKIARQGAQQQNQDRISSEIGLGDSIRKGRESAGQFLSNQNMELAGLRTANQLAGARSAGDLGLNTQQGITANQATGLKGLQSSQTGYGDWGLGQAGGLDNFSLNQAGGLDQWDISNAQLDMQAQASNSARSSQNAYQAAQANAQYQQWLTEYGNQQKQYGIGGLESLYGTNLNASQDYTGMSLDALQGKYGNDAAMLGISAANKGSSTWDKVAQIASIAGTAYGGYNMTRNNTGATRIPSGGGGDPIQGVSPRPGERSTTTLSSSMNYNPYDFNNAQRTYNV
jgi:hypothetical protein